MTQVLKTEKGKFLAQAALHAPPEVAFAMHSWPLLLPTFSLYFAHGSFPEVGQKQKTEKKERLNNGDNNGQATHGARKPPGPI